MSYQPVRRIPDRSVVPFRIEHVYARDVIVLIRICIRSEKGYKILWPRKAHPHVANLLFKVIHSAYYAK